MNKDSLFPSHKVYVVPEVELGYLKGRYSEGVWEEGEVLERRKAWTFGFRSALEHPVLLGIIAINLSSLWRRKSLESSPWLRVTNGGKGRIVPVFVLLFPISGAVVSSKIFQP